jgi:hypothetical protein
VASFTDLNWRLNPFGAPLFHEESELIVAQFDLDELATWLLQPGRAVEFVGPEGRGKSTHLRALHARFADKPFTHLAKGVPAPPIPSASVVFVDEIQRLGWFRRCQLWMRPVSFALASQRSRAWELRCLAREVRTCWLSGLGVSELETYVAQRLAWAKCSSGASPVVPENLLISIGKRHGQDVRAIESDLYDWAQQQVRLGC